MKKLFALPVIWMILWTVAIATEIKTTDPTPIGQQLSGVTISCIKNAVDKRETALVAASTTYQNGYIAALATRKIWILSAWDKTTKKDIKLVLATTSKAYKTSLTTLKKDLKASQKTYTSTYKSALKACKATSLWDLIESNDIED